MAGGVRHVQTPEGSEFYGLPIGAPITADVVNSINVQKAAQGLKPPTGALGTNAPGSAPSGAGRAAGATKSVLQVRKSSIDGPVSFKVGTSTYNAPAGSKVYRPKSSPTMAYVRTPNGDVHAFNESGEIETPEAVQQALKAKFTDEFNDPNFDVEDLPGAIDAGKSGKKAVDAVPGTMLANSKGKTIFTKTGEDAWHNDELGLDFNDQQIQFSLDSGTASLVEPQDQAGTPEAPNFKNMSDIEAAQWLAKAKSGTKLGTHIGDSSGVLVKNDEGNWLAEGSGAKGASSSDVAANLKDYLAVKQEEAPAPTEERPTPETPVPGEEKPGRPEPEVDSTGAERPQPDDHPLANVQKSALVQALSLYPAGTVLRDDETDWTMERQSGDGHVWHDSEGKSVTPTQIVLHKDRLVVDKLGAEKKPEEAPEPAPKEEPEAPQENPDLHENVTQGWVDSQKPGTTFWTTDGKFSYTKAEDGFWEKHDLASGAYLGYTTSNSLWGANLLSKAPDTTEAEPDDSAPQVLPDSWVEKPPTGTVQGTMEDLTKFAHPAGTKAWIKGEGDTKYMLATKTTKPDWWTVEIAPGLPSDFKTANLTSTGKGDVWFEAPPKTTTPSIPEPGESSVEATKEWLDSIPNGGVVTIHDDHMPDADYTKVDASTFVTTAGTYFDAPTLIGNHLTVKSLPAQKKATDYQPGDKIEKYGHLRGMPELTQLRITAHPEEADSGFTVRKSVGGKSWFRDADGTTVSPDQLANYILAGKVYMETPVGSSSPELDETPTVELAPGVPLISKKDIADAIDAMEAHTGFQIAYGLKAVQSGPVAQHQDQIKNAASAAYPDMKPKQAFLAYLKDKGGIADKPGVEPASPLKKIHVGAETPEAKSIQGLNGGDFDPADVEQAISILEEFQGKLFKAELNKKGNPLGSLDPNEIVGFNKDKSVTKQKFIDHLKELLGQHKESGDVPATADWHGKKAEDFEVGDVLNTSSGNNWEKVGANKWKVVGGDDFTDDQHANSWLDSNNITGYSPVAKTGDIEDVPAKGSETAIPMTEEELDAADIGTIVQHDDGSQWFKDADGWKWEKSPKMPGVPSESMVAHKAVLVSHPEKKTGANAPEYAKAPAAVESKVNAVDITSPQPGLPDGWDNASEAATGTKYVHPTGDVFVKQSGGSWVSKTGELDSSYIDSLLGEGKGHIEVKEQLSKTFAKDAQPGDRILVLEKNLYTKQENGVWEGYDTANGLNLGTVDDGALQNVIDAGLPVEVVQSKKPKTWDGKTAKDAPLGTVLEGTTAIGGEARWTKEEDGWRLYRDGEAKGLASDEFIQARLDDGKAHVVSQAEAPAWDGKKAKDAPSGTILNDTLHAKQQMAKQDDGKWYFVADGVVGDSIDDEEVIQYGLDKGYLVPQKPKDTDTPLPPSAPDTNLSGLTPGKYTSANGKAYMIVKADGTGVYVNTKGEVSELSVAKVKANHKAGMQTYHGVVPDSEVPTVGDPTEQAAKVTKTDTKKKGPVTLADGTYYMGSSEKYNATVYVVEGGQVKIYKGGYTSDPTVEAVPLDKVKTAFFQGKIVDANGSSVVPEGHSGSVIVWNRPTTTQALVEVRKKLQDGDFDAVFTTTVRSEMQTLGFNLNSQVLASMVKASPDYDQTWGWAPSQWNATSPWNTKGKEILLAHLDEMLAGADLSVPESDAAGLFHWGQDGQAVMPLDLAVMNLGSSYDVKTLNAQVKAVSEAFGGGKILYPPTGKYDKNYWLEAFKDGDFKKMYEYEVSSLSQKGKSHPAGYLHPGFSGNAETNKIKWGAVVPGEKPAGDVPEGEWSQISPTKWASGEIDNYLIAAQMQNPTHLTLQEKRKWVYFHKAGQKSSTDTLSATAAKRAKDGDQPLSDAPVWADDIVPAKVYDHMFDTGPYPSGDEWQNADQETWKTWAGDHWKDPDFQAALDAAGYNEKNGFNPVQISPGTYLSYNAQFKVKSAVVSYWDSKYNAWQEELKKPVYTLGEPLSGGEEGTHPVFTATDQFGRQYIFKPVGSKDKQWRADIEAGANALGEMWGYNSTHSTVEDVDGMTGIMMSYADNVGSFSRLTSGQSQHQKIDPEKMGTLETKHLQQLASEHVFDWILDNDDTHAKNMLFGADGNLVGIDKGRAFRAYGQWDGLAGTDKAHSNATLVYTSLYDAVRAGGLSEEQAKAAYQAALKAARRIQKTSDVVVEDRIRAMMANRPEEAWKKADYMTHFEGKTPENVDELVAAVLARKSSLVDQIDSMWTKIYADSPYDKPVPPQHALGEEHFSGWGEEGLISKASETKVFGTAAVHAHGGIVGGSSLLWTEKDSEGKDTHVGTLSLGSITQQKVLDFVQAKVGVEKMQPSSVAGFPNLNGWKSTASHAAKDASKHAADKEFDESLWTALDDLDKTLLGDLEHWSPDLQPNAQGNIEFPSGNAVPSDGLYQYQQALVHYQGLVDTARNAKSEGATTSKDDFVVFQPQALKVDSGSFEGPDGERYVELHNGKWLHVTKDSVTVQSGVPAEVYEGTAPGWAKSSPDAPVKDPVQYKKVNAYGNSGELGQDGSKSLTGDTFHSSDYGHAGYQYDIALPTGELISFRDAGKTNTKRSQSGLINFRLAGDDPDSSLARVQQHLETMGLDLTGATEDDAETVYWRQMFGRVLASEEGGKDVNTARKKLDDMLSSLRTKTGKQDLDYRDIPEAISLTMTPDEERQFWHDLAVQTWGEKKVNDFLSTGQHLPQYHHQDLSSPETGTGKAYYRRIDADDETLASLQKKGAMLAIGNNGKDNSLLKYISSGGMLSTEERLRALGVFKGGASSTEDQGTGGATSVFTRISVPSGGAEYGGSIYGDHVAYWNISALAETGTYSFSSDHYGNWDYLRNDNYFDLQQSVSYHTDSGNETMVQNSLTILDHLEIMVFEDAKKRDEAIQRLKAVGLVKLRGLPIEDRLIMRQQLKATVQKIRAQWKQEQ